MHYSGTVHLNSRGEGALYSQRGGGGALYQGPRKVHIMELIMRLILSENIMRFCIFIAKTNAFHFMKKKSNVSLNNTKQALPTSFRI